MPPPVDIVGSNTRETNRLRMLETLLRRPARSRGCLETVAGPDGIVELLARSRGERLTMTRVMDLVYAGITAPRARSRTPEGRSGAPSPPRSTCSTRGWS